MYVSPKTPFFSETRKYCPTMNSHAKFLQRPLQKFSQVNLSIATKKLCRIHFFNSLAHSTKIFSSPRMVLFLKLMSVSQIKNPAQFPPRLSSFVACFSGNQKRPNLLTSSHLMQGGEGCGMIGMCDVAN